MKNIKIIYLSIIALSFCLITSNLFAFGFGFYGEYSFNYPGSYKHEKLGGLELFIEDEHYIENARMDMPAYGFGITIDTSVARNRIFNYRLNIGVVNMSNYLRTERIGDMSFDGWGTKFEHIFGFGIIRTQHFRLWLGPELSIETIYHEVTSPGKTELDGYYVYDYDSMFTITYSVGAVLGFNINMGDSMSLSVYGGIRATGVSSFDSAIFTDHSFKGNGYNAFISASVIFRFNDGYVSRKRG